MVKNKSKKVFVIVGSIIVVLFLSLLLIISIINKEDDSKDSKKNDKKYNNSEDVKTEDINRDDDNIKEESGEYEYPEEENDEYAYLENESYENIYNQFPEKIGDFIYEFTNNFNQYSEFRNANSTERYMYNPSIFASDFWEYKENMYVSSVGFINGFDEKYNRYIVLEFDDKQEIVKVQVEVFFEESIKEERKEVFRSDNKEDVCAAIYAMDNTLSYDEIVSLYNDRRASLKTKYKINNNQYYAFEEFREEKQEKLYAFGILVEKQNEYETTNQYINIPVSTEEIQEINMIFSYAKYTELSECVWGIIFQRGFLNYKLDYQRVGENVFDVIASGKFMYNPRFEDYYADCEIVLRVDLIYGTCELQCVSGIDEDTLMAYALDSFY